MMIQFVVSVWTTVAHGGNPITDATFNFENVSNVEITPGDNKFYISAEAGADVMLQVTGSKYKLSGGSTAIRLRDVQEGQTYMVFLVPIPEDSITPTMIGVGLLLIVSFIYLFGKK